MTITVADKQTGPSAETHYSVIPIKSKRPRPLARIGDSANKVEVDHEKPGHVLDAVQSIPQRRIQADFVKVVFVSDLSNGC